MLLRVNLPLTVVRVNGQCARSSPVLVASRDGACGSVAGVLHLFSACCAER